MKPYFNIVAFLLLLSLSACNGKGHKSNMSFGEVTYYPDFLWTDDSIKPVTKTFKFDFSQDAKNDKECFAEFAFVDNEGKAIGTDVMQVFVDGRQLKDNIFRVTSEEVSKELEFRFSPDAEGGKHQGHLKLLHHNLDRMDDTPLSPGQQVEEVFQWTLIYTKMMNPLAKVFMWAGIIIAVALVIWFCMLRPSLFPHFGKFKKAILIRKDNRIVGQFSYSFKGAYKVVFYNEKVKQSFWKRLFVGETRTFVNPHITSELTFAPHGKGKAFVHGKGYSATPNQIPRNGLATIENKELNLTIILK